MTAPSTAHRTTIAHAPRWQRHSRENLRRAQRYSAFVRVMKRALPIAAATVAVAVVIYALQPREGSTTLTFENMGTLADDLTMTSPRLTGVDNEGQPFTVSAKTAVQEDGGAVRLKELVAHLALKDSNNLAITAAQGRVWPDRHRVEMSGGLRAVSDSGYVLQTESANVNLQTGMVQGDMQVALDGPSGHATADKFVFDKAERQLRLTGNVHMLLQREPELRP
jgi:lipopolysaccharide export system protein LptC